MTVVA
jgi:hypothetical protein